MHKIRRNIIHALLLIAFAAVGILMYKNYIRHEIYEDSSRQLLATYEQVNQTFTVFTERNWNVLADWNSNLQFISESAKDAESVEAEWKEFASRKNSWKYSDFYMFNESSDFLTANGRKGTADSIRDTFLKMYELNQPVISAYTASSGERKIVFAVPLQKAFTLNEISYTGAAVSYDTEVIEDMLSNDAFSEDSSCYLINSHGDTVLSLKPRMADEDTPDNLFAFLSDNAVFNENNSESVQSDISSLTKGSAEFRTKTAAYYLVYQPVGINDWSIIGIAKSDAVNSSSVRMVNLTMLVILALAVCLIAALIRYITADARLQARQQETLHKALEEQKEQLDMLFSGMTRIVDRYTSVDLVNNSYQYHECLNKEPLYPETGTYTELVEAINSRYVVMSDSENLKIAQLLNKEHLKRVLRRGEGFLKIEYRGRTENVYKIMNVVAVQWDENGIPEKVMQIAQDMGKVYELESLANTDGLTGLFNERCFDKVLKQKEQHKAPFVLYYLDLDRFKPVNDTYGHDMGDKLLKEVAKRIMSCIRDRDYAFRVGGDEFALMVSSNMDAALCEDIRERVKQSLLRPYNIDGRVLNIGVSCGYAVYPAEAEDTAQIRIIADKRMYAEKEKNHRNAGVSRDIR